MTFEYKFIDFSVNIFSELFKWGPGAETKNPMENRPYRACSLNLHGKLVVCIFFKVKGSSLLEFVEMCPISPPASLD